MPNLDKDFYLDKQGLRQLINELETNIVALEYDTTVSYAVGQYCVYENNFYRCTTATTGAWDSNDWVKVVISDEIPTIHSITTAQWEALTPAQKASGDYVITDATTVPLTAENVPYDDTVSGLTADNVQDAIDELSQSSGASSVAQLEDVQLSNLSDNDLLVYDSSLSGGKLWKNAKKIVTCTKAQFDAWSANNSFPYTDCKYIVTDVNNLNTTASEIPYDNTSSGLSATSVQGAIDEVNAEKANVSDFQVFSGMTRSTTDITTTNTKVTLQTKTFTVSRNSTIFVNFSAVIKTSRYTSGLNVYLDGTDIGYSCTNLTSYTTVSGSCTANIGSGSHTIELKLSGQDSGTTATLANYNTYGFNGVIIPR